MNKKYLSPVVLAALIAICICICGCKTTPASSHQSIQSKARGIAYLVTAESLLQHPEWREHFITASESLRILSTSTSIDMPMIMGIVSQLPIKELKGQHAAIIITAGTLFLQDQVGEVALTQPEELRRVALGAHDGIDLALNLSPK